MQRMIQCILLVEDELTWQFPSIAGGSSPKSQQGPLKPET